MRPAQTIIFLVSLCLIGAPLRAADGTRGSPGRPTTATAPSGPPYNRVYALLVGINQYKSGPSVGPDLRFAEHDAAALGRIFRDRYKYDVVTLLGPQASRASILLNLDLLLQTIGPQDVLIVYFAGHGATVPTAGDQVFDGYLMPQDIDITPETRNNEETYRKGAINMRDLAARLASSEVKAKHVLLLLDCCASGLAVKSRSSGGAISKDYVKEIMANPTRQILTAGKDAQEAFEVKLEGENAPGHGVFTYVLLQILSKNDVQTIASILPTLQQDVFDLVQKNYNARVFPQRKLLSDGGGDYVFIPAGASNWRTDVDRWASSSTAPRGYEPTDDKEVESVTKAAESNSASNSLESDPAWQQKVNDYERRAAAGDPKAMEVTAICYRSGLGVKRDDQRAFSWTRQAHEAGDPVGTQLFIQLLSNNIGTRMDPATAAAQSAKLKKKHSNTNAATGLAVLTLFANSNRSTGGTSGSPHAAGNNDLANGLQAFLNALNIDACAGLRDRLGRIGRELDASKTDWTKVQTELRAWKDDVNARLKSSPGEAQRKPLSDLATAINEMQKLAVRVSKENKDQLKSRLSEVSDLVVKLDPPEKK